MNKIKAPQIMALHIKGFKETEISQITGENFNEIRQFLIEHGKTPYEDAIKPWRDMNAEERQSIIKEYKLDLQATTVSIAKKYQTTQGTIYQYLKKNHVQLRKKAAMDPEVEDIIEETKKEPASAATDTSSAVEHTIPDGETASDRSTVSIYEYSTLKAECQHLEDLIVRFEKQIQCMSLCFSRDEKIIFDLGRMYERVFMEVIEPTGSIKEPKEGCNEDV